MRYSISSIREKNHALALGLVVGFCAVVGSAIALASAENGRLPGAPTHSVLPGEPSSPPGAVAIGHVSPGDEVRVGRFRLLAAGSVPESQWAVIPSQPSAERGVNLLDPKMVLAAQSQGLKVALFTPPEPFKGSLGEASWFVDDKNQSAWLWRQFYRLEADGFFPVEVTVRLAKADVTVDLIDYDPSTGQVWASEEISGVTILFAHGDSDIKVQPIVQAFFFLGDYVVSVDAPALPPEQSDAVVRSLIHDFQPALEAATGDARKATK